MTGYSDHTTGIDIALASVTLGASVIEKHFTLDRRMDGPDKTFDRRKRVEPVGRFATDRLGDDLSKLWDNASGAFNSSKS